VSAVLLVFCMVSIFAVIWFFRQVLVITVGRVLMAWVPTCANVRPGTREPAARQRLMNVHQNLVSMAQLARITSTLLSASVFAASVVFTARLTTMIAHPG